MALPFVSVIEAALFRYRALVLILFGIATLILGWQAFFLHISAGFEKQLPVGHPYMETFRQYQSQFGGANRILIAVEATHEDIFTPEFFETLKRVTDDVFFLRGVDRTRVSSLFTPNVRFIEIVEDGFAGGNVVPADFQPTPEGLERVRENLLKSGQVGRLVAENFRAAMVTAVLLDHDPQTGKPLDYVAIAEQLEQDIRGRHQSEAVRIHIIGFAKVVGDIAEGAAGVLVFFALAVLVTTLLVWLYARSGWLVGALVLCSIIAVVWQIGLLVILGYGSDPMTILLPFLTFAIAVSHGVQMANAVGAEIFDGAEVTEAARRSFRRVLIPGATALVTDVTGFLTILLIDIPIIQELAIAASLGVAVIIVTNLFLLPVLLSYLPLGRDYRRRIRAGTRRKEAVWRLLARCASPRPASVIVTAALALGIWAYGAGQSMVIGDIDAGVPELRPDSRYNRDAAFITENFAIGVDVIQVIAETPADGCIDYGVISYIDDFDWHMRNVPGVQSTLSLPTVMKTVNAGWNEGNLKWRVLSRDERILVRAVSPVETASGLLNADCSAMPVLIFTRDHKAETITRITDAVKAYADAHPSDHVKLRLATGNVGVMAATNEAVAAAQRPMLLWVYGAVLAFCLLSFRSLAASLSAVLPLVLGSLLCTALMAKLGIGLKISTLPVAALGVGIGVDYGIYILSRLQFHRASGLSFTEAYYHTLKETGSAVLLTGLTLAIGVSTWMFSALKFQADMGVLLTFMFLVTMAGAILVLPALAVLFDLLRPGRRRIKAVSL